MKNRVSEYRFDGVYGDLCKKYIGYKKGLGYKMGDSSCLLIRGMCRFFADHKNCGDAPGLSRTMVEDYVAYRAGEASKTQHMRMSLVRNFGMFANRAYGYDFYVFPLDDFVKVKT